MDMIDPALLDVRNWTLEISVMAFHLIVYSASGYWSNYFFPQYRTFTKAQKIDWNSRIPSTINAVITSLGAYLVLTSTPEFRTNPWLLTTPASSQLISVLWAYFFYDLWIVLLNKEIFNLPTVAHHALGVVLYGVMGIVLKQAHYLLVIWILTEMTTPFVNLRFHLHVYGEKDSILYVVNGFVMAFGFLLIRATSVPYLTLHTMLTHYESCVAQITPSVRSFMYFSLALISVLNIYWTFLLWRGLIKAMRTVLFGKGKPSTPTPTKGIKEA